MYSTLHQGHDVISGHLELLIAILGRVEDCTLAHLIVDLALKCIVSLCNTRRCFITMHEIIPLWLHFIIPISKQGYQQLCHHSPPYVN